MSQRPSRRSANDRRWQVSQNLQLVMLAHYIAKDKARKKELEHVMYTEASWAMGRNPGNIVEMTGTVIPQVVMTVHQRAIQDRRPSMVQRLGHLVITVVMPV